MHARALIFTLATTAIALTGCSTDDPQPLSHAAAPAPDLSPTSQPAAPPRPPQVALERACGAFGVLDKLTHDAVNPTPDPGNPAPHPNGANVIAYASALRTVDGPGLAPALNAALTAHAYAVTNLGSLINHGASGDDIASMATVADMTGRTVKTMCAAP